MFVSPAKIGERRPLRKWGTAVGLPLRPFRNLFAVSDNVLLHRRATLRRRNIPVLRNSLTRYTARHLRIRHLVQFICVGPVSNNALKNCAALLCRACVELPTCVAERYPTLRIRGYMSARSASLRKKNSSAVPLLRSGHMSAICARPSRERGDSQEGGNRRCLPSCAPARRQRSSVRLKGEKPSFIKRL